jgi:hypothetical protein
MYKEILIATDGLFPSRDRVATTQPAHRIIRDAGPACIEHGTLPALVLRHVKERHPSFSAAVHRSGASASAAAT